MSKAGRELFDCRGSERAVSRGKRTISPISMILTPYQDKGGGDFMRYTRAGRPCGDVPCHSAGRRGRPTRAGAKGRAFRGSKLF
jgi:hypothetical protein